MRPHRRAALTRIAVTPLATASRLLSARSTRIITFGDSLTAPRPGVVTYSDVLAKELPARGFDLEVINAGVPGNHTGLARERFASDVLARDPDVVTVQFGTNDSAVDVWKTPPATEPRVSRADFEANLHFFARELNARGARTIFLTPSPLRWTPKLAAMYGKPPYRPADPDGFMVTLRPYIHAMRDVARGEGAPLVDVFAAYETRSRAERDALLPDGMHPDSEGHRIVAGLLLPVITNLLGGTKA